LAGGRKALDGSPGGVSTTYEFLVLVAFFSECSIYHFPTLLLPSIFYLPSFNYYLCIRQPPALFFLVEWYKETLVLQERETCSHKDGKNIHVSHAHAFFVLRGCDCDRLSDIWNLFFTSHTHTHTLFFLGACDKAKCVMVHLIYNLFLLSGYSTETAIISQLLHFLAGALVGLWCFTGNDCLFTF